MKIPFDIKYRPQIESGEYKVETRDGKKVRVLCYDANNIVPIVALVTFNDGSEGSRDYYLNGTMNCDRENPLDLFIVTSEEEMTEFEKAVGLAFVDVQLIPRDKDGIANIHDVEEFIKKKAAELFAIAKEKLKNNIEADYKELLHEKYEQGKMDAIKDLPKWNTDSDPDFKPGKYFCVANALISPQGWSIAFKDLEKLSGFKEEK